jgi:N utilization substance protein A
MTVVKSDSDTEQIVRNAFSKHVPGIADGSIKIMRIARAPGIRTYVAAHAEDPTTNAVTECSRLQRSRKIVQELNGEPLTIILWSPSEEEFIANVLPACEPLLNRRVKRSKVVLDHASGEAHVLVDEALLQDAKIQRDLPLLSKLVGWKLCLESAES